MAKPITLSHRVSSGGWESMISANGGLPAHRYTPQVTPRWPRGSEPASEGCHQPARGCVGVDVVDCPQICFVKEVRVPPLWWSGGWGGAWSPGPGPAWCQSGRGALRWCQAVPQVRSPWRAPVAGTSDRTRRWAVSHWTSEGLRPLSFLRPLPGCLRRVPVVVVRPPRPGGFAASQPGRGAP